MRAVKGGIGLLFVLVAAFGWGGGTVAQVQGKESTPATTATVTATATVPPPQWQSIDLSLPHGNLYAPRAVAADRSSGEIYVIGSSALSAEATSALASVDPVSGAIQAYRPLPGDLARRQIVRIELAADGTGFLLDGSRNQLHRYDPAAHRARLALEDVFDFRLLESPERLLVRQRGSLALYSPDLAAAQWRLALQPDEMAADATHLLATDRQDGELRLLLYDLADGSLVQTRALPAETYVDDLAAIGDGRWAVALFHQGRPSLWIVENDADGDTLDVVAERQGLHAYSLFSDPHRQRLIASGQRPLDQGDAPGGLSYWLWQLDPETLDLRAEQPWPGWGIPDQFVATEGWLAGIYTYDSRDRLYLFDPETLALRQTVILGVRLEQMVADAGRGRLFVADNQQRIHRIDAANGAVTDVWHGGAPLALDAAADRLYAARGEGEQQRVVALDAQTGARRAVFPQGGVPVPDPARDLVYLVDRGVTVFDRNGVELGRLDETFPDEEGFVPNPYALAAAVNPVTGALVVFMNNGVPGSNNRNHTLVYTPPAADEPFAQGDPVTVGGLDSVLPHAVFDERSGDFFLTYSGFGGLSALQRVASDGTVRSQRYGRTGRLYFQQAVDSRPGILYVQQGNVLAQFGPSLALQGFLRTPVPFVNGVFDEASQHFYFQLSAQGPVLGNAHLASLPAVDWSFGDRPTQPALPDVPLADLVVAQQPRDAPILFVREQPNAAGGPLRWFRSADGGETWRVLELGTLPLNVEYISEGADGTLYYTNSGHHGGDGVLRSEDGGLIWAPINAGLPDLRAMDAVQSVDAGQLYLTTARGDLVVWEAAQARWRPLSVPDDASLGPNVLFLAPDGTLFIRNYQRLYRSKDGGETWQRLPSLAGTGETLAFDPQFAVNQRIYAFQSDDNGGRSLARSEDGGESWQPLQPGLSFPGGTYHTLILRSTEEGLVLLERDWQTIFALYRSVDGGQSWRVLADPTLLDGVSLARITADGALWLLRDGDVARLELSSLPWQPISPEEAATRGSEATPTPSPTPTGTPTPVATPARVACDVSLDNEETKIVEQAPALGCPLAEPVETFLARQPFQNGRMFWRADLRDIYVLTADGRWLVFDDTWGEDQPLDDPTLAPPDGLFEPVRGFGKVWRQQLGGPNAAIGWATAAESGADGRIQPWSGGTLLIPAPGERYALFTDGAWQRVE